MQAIDDLSKNVVHFKIDQVFNQNQSEKGGLAAMLKVKLNARVMLTVSADLDDRLVQ